jgi:hypothetical protein
MAYFNVPMYRYYPCIYLAGLRKPTKKERPDSWPPGPGSNSRHAKYEAEVLTIMFLTHNTAVLLVHGRVDSYECGWLRGVFTNTWLQTERRG